MNDKAIETRKPKNPYRKGSLIWSVMEGDWEDLTVSQIAEVLDATPSAISCCIRWVRVKTGYIVPHVGRKPCKNSTTNGGGT